MSFLKNPSLGVSDVLLFWYSCVDSHISEIFLMLFLETAAGTTTFQRRRQRRLCPCTANSCATRISCTYALGHYHLSRQQECEEPGLALEGNQLWSLQVRWKGQCQNYRRHFCLTKSWCGNFPFFRKDLVYYHTTKPPRNVKIPSLCSSRKHIIFKKILSRNEDKNSMT